MFKTNKLFLSRNLHLIFKRADASLKAYPNWVCQNAQIFLKTNFFKLVSYGSSLFKERDIVLNE